MMDVLTSFAFHPSEAQRLGKSFLDLLPHLTRYARLYFRDRQCPHGRADAIAEAVALAWRWYLRLAARGKDPATAAAGLIVFAARAVACGRRLCGKAKRKDALSRSRGIEQHQVANRSGPGTTRPPGFLVEALADNTRSPVPDQVVFRLDFPTWCRTRTQRERRMIAALMAGERPLDVARKYGLTAARISQLRREFRADWEKFCEMPVKGGCGAAFLET
jgi:hypothetical protein